MRPICATCFVEMRCEKNGVPLTIGVHHDIHWGDRFRCPACVAAVIVGVSATGKAIADCSPETQKEAIHVQ